MKKMRTDHPASQPGQWLTYAALGARWDYEPKTLQNHISSGRLPLRFVRLWENADPRVHITEVERYESARATTAGVELGNVKK